MKKQHPLPAILLGVFILAEVIYLPLGTFVKLFPTRNLAEPGEISGDSQKDGITTTIEPPQSILDFLARTCAIWGQITAHPQDWPLFAIPEPEFVGFPTVELQFDDGKSVELRSQFEPLDPDHFFRIPGPATREFNFEHSLALIPQRTYGSGHWPIWALPLAERQMKSRQAYVQWRINRYRQTHPDASTLAAAVLRVRLIAILPTGQDPAGRSPSVVLPLLRWSAAQGWEVFDPKQGTFGPLDVRRKDGQ